MAENTEMTVIGNDSHFKGELTFERAARVNGKFDGKITGKGELHVSDNALCKADVDAGSINIDGTIEGNLHAKDAVKLNAKGVVRGDIVAGKMVMAEGASFFGQCAVGPDAQKAAAAKPAQAAPQPQPQHAEPAKK
jgi:cytoskeletal protein CcmA (bactofilin family)